MALVSPAVGDQLPLLPGTSSEAAASSSHDTTRHQTPPDSSVCWTVETSAVCPDLQHQSVSSDSGCESDGAVDSAYSTVTSCTSDVIRMQLDTELSEAAMHVQLETSKHMGTDMSGAEEVSLDKEQQLCCSDQGDGDSSQLQHTQDQRVRSWSLEGRCSAVDVIEADVGTPTPLPLRHSQSEPSLAASASTASMPICRICHMPSDERADLISPCRCAGTMQFIHTGCLMHWIEVSSRRANRAPQCELCQYQYQRHKRFRMGRWLVPAVSCRDKLLHSLFLLSAVVMVTCAVVTIFCFKQDSGKRRHLYDEAELTTSEKWTLVCGILFFVAFFVGMYSQIKARYSLYHLITRLFYLNQQWLIDQYDRSKDEKYRNAHTVTFAV